MSQTRNEEDLDLQGYTTDLPPPKMRHSSSAQLLCEDPDSRWSEEARYEQVVSEEAARSRPGHSIPKS